MIVEPSLNRRAIVGSVVESPEVDKWLSKSGSMINSYLFRPTYTLFCWRAAGRLCVVLSLISAPMKRNCSGKHVESLRLRTLDTATLYDATSLQKRWGMARVVRDLTVIPAHPHAYTRTVSTTYLPFQPQFTDSGAMEEWAELVGWFLIYS